MPRLARAAIVLTLATCAVSAIAAPGDKERAKDAYDRGVAAHKQGDFARAAAEFAKADEIAPSSVALRAALDEAVAADDPAIGETLIDRSKRGPIDAPLAASLKTATNKFAHRAGHVLVTCPASCLASLDGNAIGVGTPAWAAAGQHTLVIQVGSDAQQRLIQVNADDTVSVSPTSAPVTPSIPSATPSASASIAPPPSAYPSSSAPPADSNAPPPKPTPDHAAGPSPIWFWIGAGVTVVGAAGTVLSGVDTMEKRDTFNKNGCASSNQLGCTTFASAGQDAQLRTDVIAGVTLAAGIVTAAIGLFVVDWHGASRASVGFAPTKNGAAATYAISF